MQSVEGIKKINASYQNFCHKESFVFLAKSLYEINSCGQARFFFGNFHTYIYEHSLVELALTNLRGNSVWWYQGLNVQTISVCRRIYCLATTCSPNTWIVMGTLFVCKHKPYMVWKLYCLRTSLYYIYIYPNKFKYKQSISEHRTRAQ